MNSFVHSFVKALRRNQYVAEGRVRQMKYHGDFSCEERLYPECVIWRSRSQRSTSTEKKQEFDSETRLSGEQRRRHLQVPERSVYKTKYQTSKTQSKRGRCQKLVRTIVQSQQRKQGNKQPRSYWIVTRVERNAVGGEEKSTTTPRRRANQHLDTTL